MKDWRRVEEIFNAAWALSPVERSAFLHQECGMDERLRHEVESLLAAEEELDSEFLNKSVPATAGLTLPTPPEAGEVIDSYRLVEKIGEGGMGTVFLAERADGAFDHRVAIKVLHRQKEAEEAVRRFDLERRILARLEHPGIARLLDGGKTKAGALYLVMELVDGERIDEYCERCSLSSSARVDLFLQVCAAVSAAHRNLVVHRDLKPSNVMVDGQGHAKLLDFGIAKILEPEQIGVQGEMTESWQRALTPSYASPEQIRGDYVTVATDVYLLGILLYKLLTGRLPYRFSSGSLAEAESVLLSQQPRRPSLALREVVREGDSAEEDRAPRGVQDIDSDLDHILLKALQGDPAERYGSVEEFAEDLQLFRQGLPIRARKGNRRYRLKKFVSRHWRVLGALSLFVVLLNLFSLDRAVQVRQKERALARAEEALARSAAVQFFLEDLFWTADPMAAKGKEVTVLEALALGEEKLSRGARGSLAIEASIHALFGRIRLDLGEIGAAQSSLEKSLEGFSKIEMSEESLRVSALRARGDLALALFHGSENEGAETMAQAISMATQVFYESRVFRQGSPGIALELLEPLVTIYCWLGRWEEAAPVAEEAMVLLGREGVGETLVAARVLGFEAGILKNLRGDLVKARERYQEALQIYVEREGSHHPEVANLHNQLGLIARQLGEIPLAIKEHETALSVRRRLYPDGHWETARSLEHLAGLLRHEERGEAAAEALREAAQIFRDDPSHGPKSWYTIRLMILLGEVLVESGKSSEAVEILGAELTPERRQARPPGSRLITWAEGVWGVALMDQGSKAGERWVRGSIAALRENPDGYEEALEWLEVHLKNIS